MLLLLSGSQVSALLSTKKDMIMKCRSLVVAFGCCCRCGDLPSPFRCTAATRFAAATKADFLIRRHIKDSILSHALAQTNDNDNANNNNQHRQPQATASFNPLLALSSFSVLVFLFSTSLAHRQNARSVVFSGRVRFRNRISSNQRTAVVQVANLEQVATS